MRPLLKTCGVCIAQRFCRSTLSVTSSSCEARFTVSGIGDAQHAEPCFRARARIEVIFDMDLISISFEQSDHAYTPQNYANV